MLCNCRKYGSIFYGAAINSGAFFYIILLLLTLLFQGITARLTGFSVVMNLDELMLISMLGFLFIVYVSKGGLIISFEGHLKWLLLFSILSLISLIINSNNVLYAVMGYLEVVKGYLFYILGRHLVLSNRQITFVGKFVFLLLILLVVFGFIQQLIGEEFVRIFTDKIDHRYGLIRVPGFFTSINVYADFVVFFLAIIVGFKIYNSRARGRATILLMLIGLAGLALAVSRQAVIGLVIAVILSALHIYGVSIYRKFKRLFLFFTLVTVLAASGFLVRDDNVHYSIIPEGEYLRYYATLKSLDILGDHPFFGVGGGYFGGSTARLFNNTAIYDRYEFEFGGFSLEKMATIDTLWPQIWAEYGIVGFVLYVLIFLSLLKYNKKYLRVSPNNLKVYIWGLHVVTVYFLVTSFAGPKLTNPVTAGFFMLQMGLLHQYIKCNHFYFMKFKNIS